MVAKNVKVVKEATQNVRGDFSDGKRNVLKTARLCMQKIRTKCDRQSL